MSIWLRFSRSTIGLVRGCYTFRLTSLENKCFTVTLDDEYDGDDADSDQDAFDDEDYDSESDREDYVDPDQRGPSTS